MKFQWKIYHFKVYFLHNSFKTKFRKHSELQKPGTFLHLFKSCRTTLKKNWDNPRKHKRLVSILYCEHQPIKWHSAGFETWPMHVYFFILGHVLNVVHCLHWPIATVSPHTRLCYFIWQSDPVLLISAILYFSLKPHCGYFDDLGTTKTEQDAAAEPLFEVRQRPSAAVWTRGLEC